MPCSNNIKLESHIHVLNHRQTIVKNIPVLNLSTMSTLFMTRRPVAEINICQRIINFLSDTVTGTDAETKSEII